MLAASPWRGARWLVIAPHPDDETLGAGALIHHAAARNRLGGVVFLTDGGGSDSAILDVSGRNVRLAGQSWIIRNLDLDGRGTLDRLPFTMALDLGGIAKLPILEAGMKVLRSEGVENALINGGGDVLTHGLWQGRPWRVGLRDPRSPERLLGVVGVAGAGVVASSGDYERFFFHQGQRQHHVLNPRTGRPASGVHGVSLVARDVAAVNGLGAALMVQGPQAGRALAQRMPGLAVLIAEQDGGVWQSTAMSALLEPVPS